MRRVWCAAMAAVSLSVALWAGNATAETRVPSQWPFAATSVWNAPLGTGAVMSSTSPCSVSASATTPYDAWINAASYSEPVYNAATTDPPRTIVVNNVNHGQINVPVSAQPAQGNDRNAVIVQPNGTVSDEFEGASFLNPLQVTAWDWARFDLKSGDGVTPLDSASQPGGTASASASGLSLLGGLIRDSDLQAGSIRHALALAIPAVRVKYGWVWPARGQDVPSISSTYAGSTPMGSLVAIPQRVNVDSLGLTTSVGTMIAHALQTYGAYVRDTGNAWTFYAEPNLENSVSPARADMAKLRPLVQCVSNNTPTSVGGGGTPLAPPPPLFG